MLATLLAVTSLIALPHALSLRLARPGTAMTLWLAGLAGRAALTVIGAFILAQIAPHNELFMTLTRWCWHVVVPFLTTHVSGTGRGVGDVALLLPLLLVAASLTAAGYATVRAARAISRYLRRFAVGPGPRDSLIVPGADVYFAAAGLRRPRVIVSTGALITLDDEELAAGLAHERGHIARRHRWVVLAAVVLHAVGRCWPGARHALRQLMFHVERDADSWAVASTKNRLALASVICKAASRHELVHVTPLAGGDALARVDELLGQPPLRSSRGSLVRRGAGVYSLLLAFVAVELIAGPAASVAAGSLLHCPA